MLVIDELAIFIMNTLKEAFAKHGVHYAFYRIQNKAKEIIYKAINPLDFCFKMEIAIRNIIFENFKDLFELVPDDQLVNIRDAFNFFNKVDYYNIVCRTFY
jgi:hypothetical protein